MSIRTHGQGTIYHGEDAARTAGALWRDGDVFVVRATGASYVRTDGVWVQVSVGTGTTDHADLTNLQGGTTGEYYHLTATQATDLTDGGDTTLHVHDAYIANALLTAQGDLLVRNGTVPARLALVVPDAPTINYLGVANGETDPSWKSASSAGAADAHILATAQGGLVFFCFLASCFTITRMVLRRHLGLNVLHAPCALGALFCGGLPGAFA